jgi:hypothetical protein
LKDDVQMVVEPNLSSNPFNRPRKTADKAKILPDLSTLSISNLPDFPSQMDISSTEDSQYVSSFGQKLRCCHGSNTGSGTSLRDPIFTRYRADGLPSMKDGGSVKSIAKALHIL